MRGKGLLVVLALAATPVWAADLPRVRTLIYGGMSHEPPTEEFLKFVEEARPDLLLMGVFDQRLYAQAYPTGKAAPQDPGELLARWKKVADRLRGSGIRLIGHMEMNVVSDRPVDLAEKTGWIGYYEKGWNDRLLGKRPTPTMAALLEAPDLDAHREPAPVADITALCGCRVNPKAVMACINNPGWRDVQKQMVRVAIEHGVSGFMTNRNFFGHCACEHCRTGLRRWLGEHHPAAELKARFGIADPARLESPCVVGMHRLIDSVPGELVLEKQRFAKHQVKDFFDDVYLKSGRRLRADLFAAQWNHMAFFDELHLDRGHLPISTRTTFAHGAAEERWSLSPELWARGEDLVWYCNWGTTQQTILDREYAGDTVLYGKLIRTLAQGKPYVVNKYDFYRPRNMMAEAAALGYATNAIATPWQHEEDRAAVLRYFAFLRKHEGLYREAESLAEVALLFPRRALHAGDASPLEYVEAAGRTMIREHVLFDIVPDDMLTQHSLSRYRAAVVTATEHLDRAEREVLVAYIRAGGRVLYLPVSREDRERPEALGTRARRTPPDNAATWPGAIEVPAARTERHGFARLLDRVLGTDTRSNVTAPWTVEVHAYRQPGKHVTVHLVNYNRNEKATGKSVVAREAPLAAKPVPVRLRLPANVQAKAVRFLSPDDDREHRLEFRQVGDVVQFTTPEFLVYGVCVIEAP